MHHASLFDSGAGQVDKVSAVRGAREAVVMRGGRENCPRRAMRRIGASRNLGKRSIILTSSDILNNWHKEEEVRLVRGWKGKKAEGWNG